MSTKNTPPADDVREALAEMFFYAEAPHARWKAGHDGDAAEHLYQNAYGRADDALALVRPRGTVTDTERQAVADAIDNTAVITPRGEFLGGSTIANILEVADAALEAAREARS